MAISNVAAPAQKHATDDAVYTALFVGDGVGWFTEGVVGSGAGVVVGRAAGRVAGWVVWFWQRLDD